MLKICISMHQLDIRLNLESICCLFSISEKKNTSVELRTVYICLSEMSGI